MARLRYRNVVKTFVQYSLHRRC